MCCITLQDRDTKCAEFPGQIKHFMKNQNQIITISQPIKNNLLLEMINKRPAEAESKFDRLRFSSTKSSTGHMLTKALIVEVLVLFKDSLIIII